MKKYFPTLGVCAFLILFCSDAWANDHKHSTQTQTSATHQKNNQTPQKSDKTSPPSQQKNISDTEESLMNNAFQNMIHNIDQ